MGDSHGSIDQAAAPPGDAPPAADGNGRPHERGVFRAFARDEFLASPTSERVTAILASNGGSYRVSGPRGAGKSWLMLRALDEVRAPTDNARPGIGLWYPSPSEYDAYAFLASITDADLVQLQMSC